MSGLSQQILRELVTEYQRTKNKDVLCKIFERIDNLVVYAAAKVSNFKVKKQMRLGLIDKEEIYNAAVAGAIRGIETALPSEDGGKIMARIIAYVVCEIRATFHHAIDKIATISVNAKKVVNDKMLSKCANQGSVLVEAEDLKDTCIKMVALGKMSQKDFDILIDRFVDNKTYKQLACKYNCSPDGMRHKVLNTINKVKRIMHVERL